MKKVLTRVLLILLFVVALVAFIAYSRGYRFNIEERSIVPTGILAVSSNPRSGKIYVNGAFKGATDTNLTMPPGDYTVEVKKEGYTSYKKQLKLRGEIVEIVDAQLFPINPSLSPLSNLGITKAVAIDQTDKVILFIEGSEDPLKDGVHLFEVNRGPISFFPPLKPLLFKNQLPATANFESVKVYFSPKFDQAILDFYDSPEPEIGAVPTSYLISLADQNQEPLDISTTKQVIIESWMKEKQREYAKILETYPKAFQQLALTGMRVIAFAPSETKLFYQARADITIPLVIDPPLIASNQTPETRQLEKDHLYVYDRKEDKNFEVQFDPASLESFVDEEKQAQLSQLIATEMQALEATPPAVGVSPATAEGARRRAVSQLEYMFFENNSPIQWYPNSRTIVINEELLSPDTAAKNKQFAVVDYDGTNKQTIYSGPFEKNFYVVTSDGKIVILSNLNPQANPLPDLYAVGIR